VPVRSYLGPGKSYAIHERLRFAVRVAARLLHKSLSLSEPPRLLLAFYLQIRRKREWTRGDSNP
jgi:hypothetical protein